MLLLVILLWWLPSGWRLRLAIGVGMEDSKLFIEIGRHSLSAAEVVCNLSDVGAVSDLEVLNDSLPLLADSVLLLGA